MISCITIHSLLHLFSFSFFKKSLMKFRHKVWNSRRVHKQSVFNFNSLTLQRLSQTDLGSHQASSQASRTSLMCQKNHKLSKQLIIRSIGCIILRFVRHQWNRDWQLSVSSTAYGAGYFILKCSVPLMLSSNTFMMLNSLSNMQGCYKKCVTCQKAWLKCCGKRC